MSSPLPPKKDVAVALLQASPSVFIHLDPRRERVSVPPQFRRQSHLVLEIGLNMPVPIHDLEVDDDGITCTLSFSRTPHWCRMPWASVFAIVGQDQRGMVWPDDVPPDSEFRYAQAPAQPPPSKPKARPKPVRVVKAPEPDGSAPEVEPTPVAEAKAETPEPSVLEPAAQEPSAADDQPKPKGRKLPPYLRVVK